MIRVICAVLAFCLITLPSIAAGQTFSYGRTIFLHGLSGSTCEFDSAGCAITGPPYRTSDSLVAKGVILGTPVVYSDPGDPTVAQRVTSLRSRIDASGGRAVLVGHSMGGVVARAAYFSNSSNIAGIVSVSSPLQGAPIASNANLARNLIRKAANRLSGSLIPIYDPLSGGLLRTVLFNYLWNVVDAKVLKPVINQSGVTSMGARDLQTVSPVILNQKSRIDPLPHANVMGQIPVHLAFLRLAASVEHNESLFNDYSRRWNKSTSTLRKCSLARFAVFVNPLLGYIGHNCRTAYKLLDKASGSWYRITRTPSDHSPFDGVVTHARMEYPGIAVGDNRRVVANGANHLNITYSGIGTSRTATAMINMGMR
jgi:pimeloyl-ACP methyl ester carboxylesterase